MRIFGTNEQKSRWVHGILAPHTGRTSLAGENRESTYIPGHGTEGSMGNDMGRSANRMAVGAMANATHFEKKELLRLQVSSAAC